MADYKTHLTTSTVLGIGYAAAGYFYGQLPAETCLLAGGLCSVSGMLPDLDSDSGRPVQEMTGFAAAVIPMLMLERFRDLGWSHEMMTLAACGIYVLVRFGVAELFKRYTVHRGMWHSIPACLVCGLLTFLIVAGQDLGIRMFKSGAVMAGFMSHLILDELWSFSLRSGRLNIKRSFGTAIKFWGRDRWANFSVYAKLVVVAFLAVGDPMLRERYGLENKFGQRSAQDVIHHALRMAGLESNETVNR
jgi:LexA-binding, inner membrane-associated putative hydrolase